MNYDYAKLKGGSLEYAPNMIEGEDGTQYIPPSVEMLTEYGYKKVVRTPYPQDGKTYKEVYTETGTTIEVAWEELPPPPPTPLDPTVSSLQADVDFLMIMGGYADMGLDDLEGLEDLEEDIPTEETESTELDVETTSETEE